VAHEADDETPPDNAPPDEGEEQPAWMTREGRLPAIPFKKLHKCEHYTEQELEHLADYWTEERTRAVAEWVDHGAPRHSAEDVPACLPEAGRTVIGVMLDLRGINLYGHLGSARTEDSPRPQLGSAHLEHANLSRAHLEHAWLAGTHLEHANLMEAHLEHADLLSAHLEHATLDGAHLEHAYLRKAHLEHATLGETHLEDAVMDHARLEHAQLFGTHLDRAMLAGAHLEYAQLIRTRIVATVLTFVIAHETRFADVIWKDDKGRGPKEWHVLGLDVRGLRNSDAVFDQYVRQSNFIWRCRETWWNPWPALARRLQPADQKGDTTGDAPESDEEGETKTARGRGPAVMREWPPPLWLLWKVTCDCGRSFLRWAVWCLGIALVFGLIFWLGGVVEVPGPSEAGREANALTYFYFSIVTFTTLGFGDVTPTGNAGEIWVMLEVILGYVMLGGLISIFTTKLIPAR
jgi:uncharacterized protein YjbI with pentapeptide repeats